MEAGLRWVGCLSAEVMSEEHLARGRLRVRLKGFGLFEILVREGACLRVPFVKPDGRQAGPNCRRERRGRWDRVPLSHHPGG